SALPRTVRSPPASHRHPRAGTVRRSRSDPTPPTTSASRGRSRPCLCLGPSAGKSSSRPLHFEEAGERGHGGVGEVSTEPGGPPTHQVGHRASPALGDARRGVATVQSVPSSARLELKGSAGPADRVPEASQVALDQRESRPELSLLALVASKRNDAKAAE